MAITNTQHLQGSDITQPLRQSNHSLLYSIFKPLELEKHMTLSWYCFRKLVLYYHTCTGVTF